MDIRQGGDHMHSLYLSHHESDLYVKLQLQNLFLVYVRSCKYIKYDKPAMIMV